MRSSIGWLPSADQCHIASAGEDPVGGYRAGQSRFVQQRRVLASPEGVEESCRTAGALLNELAQLGSAIETQATPSEWNAMLFRNRPPVTVNRQVKWANTLDDSELCVTVSRGCLNVRGRFAGEKKELEVDLLGFEQPTTRQVTWRHSETGQMFSSTQLVDRAARRALARVQPTPK